MSNTENKQIDNLINKLKQVYDNQYARSFILLFVVVYGGALGSGNKPPQFILNIFKFSLTRILLLSIIIFEINRDIYMSIGVAIAFYLTQTYIFKQESFEQIKNLEQFNNFYNNNNFNLIETPQPAKKQINI